MGWVSIGVAWAQKIPLGAEFQVNSYTTDGQGGFNGPRVASDAAGGFVVVWEDFEFDREFVVARRFNSSGAPLGPEFQVNNVAYEVNPAVSSDAAGNFVVVWNDDANIYARLFDDTGMPQGGKFQVDQTGYYSRNAKVASDAAGNFVVVWWAYVSSIFHDVVVAQRFASSGTAIGGHFQVNTHTTHCCGYSIIDEDFDAIEVAADSAGNFIVVWNRDRGEGVFARTFDSAGMPHGAEFQANTTPTNMTYPDVGAATDSAGRFIVVWDAQFRREIRARRFTLTGTPVGSEFVVSPDIGNIKSAPSVAADSTGNFVVIWDDLDEYGVFLRQFDSAGTALGTEFQVDTYDYYYQKRSAVAAAPSGDFVVVWRSEYQDGDSWGVFGRRFGDLPPAQLLTGRRLQIRNRIPENPERNKGTWTAKDPSVVMGAPGSPHDPRCNGDPPGTVKATVRFFSDGSAGSTVDTGDIPLPCENWLPMPPNLDPSGYKYKDRLRAAGPCKSVTIKDGSRVKASCSGRPGVATFPYDLTLGTDEGIVRVVLTTGLIRYCGAFDDFNGRNGSDGKRFVGKDAPAPGSCPVPGGSPSPAFVDPTMTVLD
jgi:hypothetical protein